MEQSKHLVVDQIIQNIHNIGFSSKIFKILRLKVGELSMAMEGNGGRTHAKSTKHLYVIRLNSFISFSSSFFLLINTTSTNKYFYSLSVLQPCTNAPTVSHSSLFLKYTIFIIFFFFLSSDHLPLFLNCL
jgi:hypothetical protein